MHQETPGNRPIILGEVLFDQFPSGESILGGAPFNVAWHLQGFGASPLFISRIGEDHTGAKVHRAMEDWGMDCSALQRDADHPTGAVQVSLNNGEPSFHILPDQAYDYIDAEAAASSAQETIIHNGGLLYHGTLILRTGRGVLEQLLANTTLPVFVDVNLRDPWWNASDLPSILARARWLKVNDVELTILADHLDQQGNSLEETVRRIRSAYGVELLIITRGASGAVAFHESGETVSITPEKREDGADGEIVDTVGAGDAFSAMVMLGLLRGWSLPTIMKKAQAFASRVCRLRGAISLEPGFYDMD
uniref:Fructokinase n=1 Tax=Candidatus Kentrum sp. MB TaxID=2138164 RepID=A0A450X888_9GAMM|nr:MAG: fructokinase [Candidatus Kentron sp. MB]